MVFADATVMAMLLEQPNVSEVSLLLENAVEERIAKIAGVALDVLMILDNSGSLIRDRQELDISDDMQRYEMVEIIESLGANRLGMLIVPLLKFSSWGDLSRFARNRLKIKRAKDLDPCDYFLQSENKWVVVCAAFLKHTHDPLQIDETRASLLRFEGTGHRYVKAILSETTDQDGEDAMRTFELLNTVLFLKKTDLFKNISGEKLMDIAHVCEEEIYDTGMVLSRQGQVADHLYIVKEGMLEIFRTTDAGELIVAELTAGQTYGEIGLFQQTPRSASARTIQTSTVVSIKRSALKRLMKEAPEIAYNFLEIFSEKLLKSSYQHEVNL
jgi:hypothetical protein